MEEIFKDIPCVYDGYQVSNLGIVKSIRFGKERLLKLQLNRHGYYCAGLSKGGNTKMYKVHQLVAMAFLNHVPCGHKAVINHKDFDRKNNNLDNLEIVTARENGNQKHIKSTSDYIGVSWNPGRNKWSSFIKINGKTKNLGNFESEHDAHLAYQTKLKEITNE